MVKKILKYSVLGLKWLCVLIGAVILFWLGWIAVKSLGEIGEDISKKDLGHQFKLKQNQPITGKQPNILLILADDLGYGDLGCYGSTSIATPVLDSLAAQGIRYTSHYAGASVCSPSRYALMTGRYPIRGGFSSMITPTGLPYSKKYMWHLSKVFNQIGAVDMGTDSKYNGILHKEITVAEALKQAGYKTGMSGKWHLGDLKSHPEFNPRFHGFDDFLGLNAANDEFPAALFDNDSMLVEDIGLDQDYLTRIFAERAIQFIENTNDQPFFYYLSFTAPHLPLLPSVQFKGKSKGGVYGDVVEEMDFYIGKVLESLEKQGLLEETIVIFTSDNGPWFKGSPGNHRGRKGQSYEGGYRVPLIVKWTGQIAENQESDIAIMNFDLYPTLLETAGLSVPDDREIDGRSLATQWVKNTQQSPHESLYFYHFSDVEAVRSGKWKYYRTVNHYTWPVVLDKKGLITNGFAEPWFGRQYPNLYDLELDAAENYDLKHHHPKLIEKFEGQIEQWEQSVY